MGKVLCLKERLRKKKYGDPGESLKGRGFPIDMTFGPDDLEEPITPAPDVSPSIPEEVKKECPSWILRILEEE